MLLEVGSVVKPHGLAGDVIVELVTDRTERLSPGSVLRTDAGDLEVLRASRHHRRWIVSFAGVTGWEAAEALRGTVLRAPPMEDGEALWVHELVGAEVLDARGVSHGPVTAVEANPASDLLVLETGALVPLRFVVSHDRESRRVVVDPPEGLLPCPPA